MNDEKSKEDKNILPGDNPLKVRCPCCGLNSTIPLDPKQISDKKSLHLCLVCSHVFEYINPTV